MKNKTIAILLLIGMLALTFYTYNSIASIDEDPFIADFGDVD